MLKLDNKEYLPLQDGFSLLELLLIVLIIASLFATVVPKLISFRIDAQHEIVRQSCKELTASVQGWLQKMINAQDDHRSTATLADYVATLANRKPLDPFSDPEQFTGQWIATTNRPNNWNINRLRDDLSTQRVSIPGRQIGNKRNAPPESVVEKNIPKDRGILNPFNKKNIFRPANDPLSQEHVIPGAIAFASVLAQDGTLLYGFCFQGSDSTTLEWTKESTFHNRQNIFSPQGIEQCIPFAKYR